MNQPGILAGGAYDFRLAVLSVVLAASSAYCALTMSSSGAIYRGRQRTLWVAGAAAALGLGIWATGGIGLASFSPYNTPRFAIAGLLGSLSIAVAGCWAALDTASRENRRGWAVGGAGILLGATLLATHMFAINAMYLPASWSYQASTVYGAAAAALAGSSLTVWLVFRTPAQMASHSKELASLLLGLTVAGTFYGVLSGVHTGGVYEALAPGSTVASSSLAAIAIAASIISILGSAAATAVADRRLFQRALSVETSTAETSTAKDLVGAPAQPAAAGMYQASRDGRLLDVNEACARLWGYDSREEARGGDIRKHFAEPDEFTKLVLNLELNGRGGVQELRLVKRDGSALWVLHNASMISRDEDGLRVIQASILEIAGKITGKKLNKPVSAPPERQMAVRAETTTGERPTANILSLGTAVAFAAKSVLVADASPTGRQTLLSLLECWQITPTVAASPEEATKHLLEARRAGRKIDLLLMDSRIGGKGFSFLAQLRRKLEVIPPVVMVMDAAEKPPQAESLRSFGISAYVVKPVWRTDMEQAMLRALFGTGPYPRGVEIDASVAETEKDTRLRL